MKLSELHENFDRYAIHDLSNPLDKEVEKVDNIDDLAARIKANCGTMLNAYKIADEILYRGIKASEQVVITGIRPNRLPVDMELDKHKELEKYFKKRGLTVTRSNCLFTSARHHAASSWGEPYIIFIKDGWTALVFDGSPDDYAFYRLRGIADKLLAGRRDEVDEYFDNLKPREFTDSDSLARVINNQYYEVLFSGDSYIAIKENGPIWKKLKVKLGL